MIALEKQFNQPVGILGDLFEINESYYRENHTFEARLDHLGVDH